MNTSPDFPFARRLTLVRALALLTQPTEIQRRIDSRPLPDGLREAEAQCEASVYAEYGYCSSAQKTERFGRDLHKVLRAKELAAHFEPVSQRYNANDLIQKLTSLRQWADKHGIPYGFFSVEAARHLVNRNNLIDAGSIPDTPELDDLMREDVLDYVRARWDDPALRLHHPFEPHRWDQRFRSKRRRGEPQHQALSALVGRRIEDAQYIGHDGAKELRCVLPAFMEESVAAARFGEELVALAINVPDDATQILA